MPRLKKHRHLVRSAVCAFLSLCFLLAGTLLLWVSSWKLPDLSSLDARKVSESTKIYDRTGEILLYDLHRAAKRTVVPYAEISRNVKNATVATEDSEFWQHRGIQLKAILRAAFSNLFAGNLLGGQGGSTITQQVVKNSLLTREKTLARKLKEWVLALRLEKTLDKETILALYLNEIPYGGTVYGVEEAAQTFFGKSSRVLSITEAAYLAALPNAPTYYSPYGNHRNKLEERKNLVLRRMKEEGFITEKEYERAKQVAICAPSSIGAIGAGKEALRPTTSAPTAAPVIKCTATFQPNNETGILAPHFVTFVRQYLEETYSKEALEERGFRVITTLDYELQKIAEEIVKKYALQNKETFDAENAALVAVDPKTGQILAMVGSRDYFDKEIDGNFNATIAYRQPGSAFKPFAYAEALRKGFTPETVVFDLPTEFSTECNPDGTPIREGDEDKCYKPENYDGKYRGPISLRDALAQSVNVASIQVLYLAGLRDSLRLAKDLGIGTLGDPDRYGLTLVLGGGEVKLLELTSAYAAFAAEGVRRESAGILHIEGKDGALIEEWRDRPEPVLEPDIALQITDILSDNKARTPAFGATSPLSFPGRSVAAKTGTTNDFRDAWIVGYTPNLAVGAWAGNNDNRPMHKIAAYIVAPLWHAFLEKALERIPAEPFRKPPERDIAMLPPILRGVWQGGETYFVDKLTGKLATEFTPPELREERAVRNIHSTLYWIDKNNPRVPRITAPDSDPQFPRWEYAVSTWVDEQGLSSSTAAARPTENDDLHRPEFAPRVSLLHPVDGESLSKRKTATLQAEIAARFPLAKVHFFVDNAFVGSAPHPPWQLSFTPSSFDLLPDARHTLTAVVYDVFQNRGEASVSFTVAE